MIDALSVFTSFDAWASLLMLTGLEIVLGFDNIVFITIIANKLPKAEQTKARRLGLAFALITRLGLLLGLKWLMGLTEPLFSVASHWFSGRDLILLSGGLFLIGKSTLEMFETLEVKDQSPARETRSATARRLAPLIIQIMILDIVFSLDSVITAIGMARHIAVMVCAMIIAVIVMLVFARAIGDFINDHPSIKILALSFLLLIGVLLTAESFGQHINKGYVYFAMAFSFGVELINMRLRAKQHDPVHLHNSVDIGNS